MLARGSRSGRSPLDQIGFFTNPLPSECRTIAFGDDDESMNYDHSARSLWVWRWAILALGAALSLGLIVRGNVLIGGLVGAMVVARGVLFVKMRRRREELRRRFEQRRRAR
jgi:hypothetical protein